MVVATAKGTVTAVNDDAEYGHNVWVSHDNGYVTIYRNQGTATVEVGDTVAQGTTLFIMSKENLVLGYQVMKDGSYVDPMDVLEIKG
jgi:murein DD-endopeptidase MepM/ murein hydrolase activator NlpD